MIFGKWLLKAHPVQATNLKKCAGQVAKAVVFKDYQFLIIYFIFVMVQYFVRAFTRKCLII